ncbi:conserved hypothetical protein ['Nostoc azollae' 0708]|mgnify:FL=1|jgi:hypothetical protein|uniref:Uncharacterized protein n=2 Tax=Trichormus azollae TaxID=1164 RepID=D7E156_NOSA0|nr:conserved hypothetical protein ['Nostoc azollae' 0708]
MNQLTGQGVRAITKYPMVDRINDIAWQARQGSVAAIIQLLNEKLVIFGVRTRAIFADGVLQLLCEAATEEQLDQSTLVQEVQQILDSIAPRNIRTVNINCRIVREEQLLWLEEINRNPTNQFLWSQETTLSQPGLVKQLIQDLKAVSTEYRKPILPKSQPLLSNKYKQKISVRKLVLAATGLAIIIVFVGQVDSPLGKALKNLFPLDVSPYLQTTNKIKSPTLSPDDKKSFSNPANDSFADAVRLANQATTAGKVAITSTQWWELAARWQRASDLMNQVSAGHSRYQEAQIRTKLYKEYSKAAQKEAEKTKSIPVEN